MINIDGAAGEGGGQILRTTISLAMCLQKPARIVNIRAGRKRPGLLRQHLAAIRSAAEVCNAELDGEAQITFANIPGHVAKREQDYVQRKCQWPGDAIRINEVESPGPGNIVSLRIGRGKLREVFEAVGSRGITAERVAGKAVKAMRDYLAANVPVGEYLSDQLLLPMVLAQGGQFLTVKPSLHSRTNIDVIEQITGVSIDVEQRSERQYLFSVPGYGVIGVAR